MFQKLVAIEPINWDATAAADVRRYAKEVVFYDDIPLTDAHVAERIGDADAVLVSYTAKVSGEVLRNAPKLNYVGMCCSLYSEASANVDIAAARANGILVKGVRDYGDEGVAEFVVSELVQLLHGFGGRMWDCASRELTDLRVGIIGLGVSGRIVANALRYFGANVSYFSRTRKTDAEADGIAYRELDALLAENEVLCTCLNRNTIVLHAEQFELLQNRKILINTGIGPSFDSDALEHFVERDNYFICDSFGALDNEKLLGHRNVRCAKTSSGVTQQARVRLGRKALANIESALAELS